MWSSSWLWNNQPAFTLARILERVGEFAQPVYMCFVDLEKAYNQVPCEILREVLGEYGERGQKPKLYLGSWQLSPKWELCLGSGQ